MIGLQPQPMDTVADRALRVWSWAGCDSALAAPLVLDLARLTAAAHRWAAELPQVAR